MRVFSKFIETAFEPEDKNVIWFDGYVFRIYKNGEWSVITLTEKAIAKLIKYAEGLDIYIWVDELPEVGEPKHIYLLQTISDEDIMYLTEYVYENGWKEVGNFNDIEIIIDSSFEKGDGKNSAVLKGNNCSATGYASTAIGEKTTAIGNRSFTSGEGTIANNIGEAAFGKYNFSSKDITQFSIGIGKSNNRKNALVVTANGEVYINGIGKYTGISQFSGSDLATYIKSLETRIKELEDIISQITEQE